MSEQIEDHDRGLSHDLPTLLSRRRMLGIFGGGLAAVVAGCSSTNPTRGATTSASNTSATTATATATRDAAGDAAGDAAETVSGPDVRTGSEGEIPEETGGPFPADGSNGQNVLTESGVVRRDIRSSFGASTTTATGVPLTFSLTVVDVSGVSDAGSLVTGAAVYAWHADSQGRYSMYSDGVTEENYLRGVQVTDASGTVTFTSIFPSCYDGRWPHIHFEIYPTVADATKASNPLRTSQLALPEDVCKAVYATSGYDGSASNLERVSLERDMVFADGYALQLATVTGSVSTGYTATLRVPV